MTNHYHLQMRSKEVSISKIMSLVNKRYANYFNWRYQLTGHVFEKRFFDKVIYGEEGMFETSRYIHLNPVEAGMVKKPEQYHWSSYYLYMNQKIAQPNFMDIGSILNIYTGTEKQKMESYRQDIEDWIQEKKSFTHKLALF